MIYWVISFYFCFCFVFLLLFLQRTEQNPIFVTSPKHFAAWMLTLENLPSSWDKWTLSLWSSGFLGFLSLETPPMCITVLGHLGKWQRNVLEHHLYLPKMRSMITFLHISLLFPHREGSLWKVRVCEVPLYVPYSTVVVFVLSYGKILWNNITFVSRLAKLQGNGGAKNWKGIW